MEIILTSLLKNTPDSRYSFWKNYIAHIEYLSLPEDQSPRKTRIPEFVLHPLVAFKPFRDAHDFTDVLLGATVTAILGVGTTIAFLFSTINGLINTLGDAITFSMSSEINYCGQILDPIVVGLTLLIISIALAIHSMFSLLTRAIATAVMGFAPQDTPRFYYEEKDILTEDEEKEKTVTDIESEHTISDEEHQKQVALPD
jgi:hypothetical protein